MPPCGMAIPQEPIGRLQSSGYAVAAESFVHQSFLLATRHR